jgi:HAD superfamily hydrolase (TIGR01509 family)
MAPSQPNAILVRPTGRRMKLEAIIFDCDGTLVDSERIGVEVIADVASEHGALIDVDAAMQRLRGLKLAECVTRIEDLSGVKLPDAFIPEVRRRTAEEFRRRLRPIDGARDLLASLRVPFCVASSGPREKIELSLSATGLLPLIRDRIFSSYEVGSWKPHPGLFLHAAAAMGMDPSSCGVVEDSAAGIEAGVAAGMQVFAFGDHQPNVHGGRVRHVRTHYELKLLLDPVHVRAV